MDLNGKKIAILGGTRISCEIVRAAKGLGMYTEVIDYNPPEESPGKQISDGHALISVADTDAVAEYLVDNRFDGAICGYTDSILGWYAEICSKAGLPCYGTAEQFSIFTDKHRWKALCREFGVPTAEEYGPEVLEMGKREIPFPLFVKPADASGSRGTAVARDRDELRAAWDVARKWSRNGEVVVERYLDGPEVTVFWLFVDGELRVNLLGNRLVKHNQEGCIPLPAGYTFPSSVLPRYLEEVAPRVRAMLSSVGVRDGMMFMQCCVQDGLPYVYDIGYRLTGSLEHHITKAVAGYSAMDMLLHFAVTGRMTDDPQVWERVEEGLYAPCFNISYLMRPGTVGRFEGIDRVRRDDNVIAVVEAHDEGETLPLAAKGELRQIAVRVLGSVEDPRSLRDVMLGLQAMVRIVSPDEEDLLLPGLEPRDFDSNVLEGRARS